MDKENIWVNDRDTVDGRYHIARVVIRGHVAWKVQDLTTDRHVVATRHTLTAARAEVEDIYRRESQMLTFEVWLENGGIVRIVHVQAADEVVAYRKAEELCEEWEHVRAVFELAPKVGA